ncbi:MAG: ABC transporter ATP-binding protein [Synergistaceae bacterium]|jgi:branched-chain amino acid transport system ATP-binding protein|nr:ABC transporter ATP-binding protein [Synergistaceae bacterium]
MTAALLEVRGLTRVFGGIKAVDSLSFDAHEGGVTGLIGPNGAGKTTVFNLITGVYRPTAGTIRLAGESLTGRRPDDVARAGVARTFQNIRLFARMTCLENVTAPILARASYGPFAAIFRAPAASSAERAAREKAFAIMRELGIEETMSSQASNLPYGTQRKLEIARALACSPKLVLLDEPAAGMNDAETRELGGTIRRVLADFGVTILLIEHHINLVLDICDHVVVMERGALLARGAPGDIRENGAVVDAYLGRRRERAL